MVGGERAMTTQMRKSVDPDTGEAELSTENFLASCRPEAGTCYQIRGRDALARAFLDRLYHNDTWTFQWIDVNIVTEGEDEAALVLRALERLYRGRF